MKDKYYENEFAIILWTQSGVFKLIPKTYRGFFYNIIMVDD